MTNLEDTLREQLQQSASRVRVPADLAARARRAGTRRRQRRQRLAVVAIPVLATALGVGGLTWADWTGSTPARTVSTPAGADDDSPIQLTPQLDAALKALQPPGLQAGHNDPFTNTTPIRQWTTWLDCDQVSQHLGLPLPTFDALSGYQVMCGSQWGPAVFDRPLLTSSGAEAADSTRIEVLYLPPGIDERTATFAEATAAGASWLLITYGGDLGDSAATDVPLQPLPGRPDATVVELRNGEQAGVQIVESGSLIAWSAHTAGRHYGVQLYQPRNPAGAVRVFSTGHRVPLGGEGGQP